ncbi:hypothetical protein PSFL6913_29755 [Pseudomonas fluorescens]|uniref:Uncharacterized protein n=2 Tax=Pseudomonas fluorescens TaxID=294 RepID=A0ABY1TC70_PSEFL|nr:hypothetical protein SAMN04488487_3038 [Pseudomonas fluorescens]SQF89547.1 Uncharacterised protein [Pseudomonas fluorescens]
MEKNHVTSFTKANLIVRKIFSSLVVTNANRHSICNTLIARNFKINFTRATRNLCFFTR